MMWHFIIVIKFIRWNYTTLVGQWIHCPGPIVCSEVQQSLIKDRQTTILFSRKKHFHRVHLLIMWYGRFSKLVVWPLTKSRHSTQEWGVAIPKRHLFGIAIGVQCSEQTCWLPAGAGTYAPGLETFAFFGLQHIMKGKPNTIAPH